ncbi:MAG: Holliday junction resolvase RuvX [Eubacteriales bacterium]|nr:Holliday junction resolvase RuvX [Eubacteriales bacterium]
MRLLGLDYGEARIGVALGDTEGLKAFPHSVFRHKGWGPDTQRIKALIVETGAAGVVLGLPRNMDGSLGPQAKEAQGLGGRLEAEGIPVYYQDERLSSFEAEEALRAGGLDSRQIRKKVDQTAASLILQRHLDSLGYNG